MSSDPNTPDFDSMSPEEMMAWMESLAKRQGADEGFTTSADLEIDEVDPTTVDESILNQKYIPDGWTEEKWDAHLAKEEEKKRQRQAERQQAEAAAASQPPAPEPEPEPAVSQPVASGGEPDFDSMSPEELMEWMESLAKRQGAAEGFTTGASMQVAEVDPSTVDESILNQKYIPDGWTEEKWDEYLAKEEEKKRQKAQATPPQPELIYDDDDDDDDEQLADLNLDDLPTLDLTEEETVAAPDNPMSWLEDLASADDDSEELDIPDLSALDDVDGLAALAQDDDDSDPMDWLANLAGDAEDAAPDFSMDDLSSGLEGLAGLEELAMGDDEDDDDDEDEDEAIADVEDPVSFLDSLARMEGAPEDELSTDAGQAFLDDLQSSAAQSGPPVGDLLDDTQPSEELELEWDSDNPEAWLEALAQNSADDDAEPVLLDNGDDDLDLSFMQGDDDEDDDLDILEEADGDHDSKVINALNQGADVSPEDIQKFFESQFDRANTEFAHLDNEPLPEPDDDEEIEAAVAPSVPDWLQELGAPAPQSPGAEEPDEVEDEDEELDLMADVLADMVDEDEEDEDEELDLMDNVLSGMADAEDDDAEAVEIPDWLNESAVDEDDEAEAVEIPDWLQPDTGEIDSGDIISDIIADELDMEPGETAVISTPTGEIEVDPNDTWTQAFLMENREADAEAWYTQRLSQIEGEDGGDDDVGQDLPEITPQPDTDTIAMTSPPGQIALQDATLPIEEELPEGQPEVAPAWLTGEAVEDVSSPVPEFVLEEEDEDDIEMPDWLTDSIEEDDIEIPDWLNEEEPSADPIPDWLNDAGISDIEPASVPDWLKDTVEEPSDIVAETIFTPEPEPEPEPALVPAPPAPMITTPPPAANVEAAIQSAQQKVAAGNVEEALKDYESVVRANDGLDVVIKDLEKLTKDDKHKKNPAVYRTLGDALMRHGDLQDALDTYRRALNML